MSQHQSPAVTKLLVDLDLAEQALRDAGVNIVRVASTYGEPEDTHFHTSLSLHGVPAAGVTKLHAFLDAVRELADEASPLVTDGTCNPRDLACLAVLRDLMAGWSEDAH